MEISSMNETAPYTVKEVAALTAFSERTVTKMFENEKGVLIYEVPRLRKRAIGPSASRGTFTSGSYGAFPCSEIVLP